MNRRNILLAAAGCVVLLLGAAVAVPRLQNRAQCQVSGFAMDTVITVNLTGRDSEAAAQGVLEAVSGLDSDCLSRTAAGADVARANAEGSAAVSSQTAEVVSQALSLCKKSGGALDVGLGTLSDLWGVKQNTTPPSPQAVAALGDVGYEHISLQGDTLTVAAPTALDLGAVGKGAACDAVKAYLDSQRITRGVVAVGGSVLLYGEGDFTVGICSPERGSSDYIATVTMGAGCISTSGTYERYFDYDGVRYHHILDPATGYPVQNGLTSVTVISQSGLQSDGLATACFVMGLEKGAAFAREMGAEAVFADETGNLYATAGIYESITVTDTAYTLKEIV